MDEVVKAVKNEINPKQMNCIKDKKENQMKKTRHGQKRCLVSQGLHWIRNPKGHNSFRYSETQKSGYICQSKGMQMTVWNRVGQCVSVKCFAASQLNVPRWWFVSKRSLSSFSKQCQTLMHCPLGAQEWMSCKTSLTLSKGAVNS